MFKCSWAFKSTLAGSATQHRDKSSWLWCASLLTLDCVLCLSEEERTDYLNLIAFFLLASLLLLVAWRRRKPLNISECESQAFSRSRLKFYLQNLSLYLLSFELPRASPPTHPLSHSSLSHRMNLTLVENFMNSFNFPLHSPSKCSFSWLDERWLFCHGLVPPFIFFFVLFSLRLLQRTLLKFG